jgi:hypothetical protein
MKRTRTHKDMMKDKVAVFRKAATWMGENKASWQDACDRFDIRRHQFKVWCSSNKIRFKHKTYSKIDNSHYKFDKPHDLMMAVMCATRKEGETFSQAEIADMCGMSSEGIRQIEERALMKLRKMPPSKLAILREYMDEYNQPDRYNRMIRYDMSRTPRKGLLS